MSPTRSGLVAAGFGAVIFLSSAQGDVARLGAAKDNTLYENAAGSLSNGAGDHFFAGHTGLNTMVIRRGLIAFDVAADIPAGSTIHSATLTLNMSRTLSGTQPVALHRLLSDWGEGLSHAAGFEGGGALAAKGDATWVHTFFPDSRWLTAAGIPTPGGDFAAASSASISIGGAVGFYSWGSTANMVADVQMWLDNPSANFGWLLRGNESVLMTTKRFDSKDNLLASVRPVLEVCYSPPNCATCSGDLDGNARADGADIAAFLACFLAGNPAAPGCGCADMDANAVFDAADISMFVDRLLTGPAACCSSP